ncbi:hypothetical protein crov477 [Cafeteria roenbergensis virus]|uniref:Uncharacterized protein n=1 Tax=Cafeteria roenbergensis virus (strain BV-PW1) TaxID=693272 RepID=E3T5P8_CROVB|nr:hypothetical protein crov477 [Cafeteria roenbergensis virus BV-PW1]ADO67511.1 hypothetical protein crov477 [Cafeteria roenbergensis virus BV-PW1]
MKIIPLTIFNSFKNKTDDIIYLFNKKIINKVKKTGSIKKKSSMLNLYLNKINIDNYIIHAKKFISEQFISKEQINTFTKNFFALIITEDNFTEQYLLFYKIIIENYYSYHKFDFSYLVNLTESKFLMDFKNKRVLLEKIINDIVKVPDDITLKEKENYLKSIKINNLKIIYYMIKHNILNKQIMSTIYTVLDNDTNFEYLYEFIKISKDIDYLKTFDFTKCNLRLQTLFKELLNNLEINNVHVDCKKEENNPKISHKLLIINVIEEYIFLDEIDEVITFIENYILKKNLQIKFVETVILYGTQHNKSTEMTQLLEKVKNTLKKKPVIKMDF